MFDKTSKVFYI